MGLEINQEKTKYMTTSQNAKQSGTITTDHCAFEVVQTFTHLGTSAKCNNDINQEIKKLTLIDNKMSCGLLSQFKSHIYIHGKVKSYYVRY